MSDRPLPAASGRDQPKPSLRVAPNDEEYRRQAKEESAYWHDLHPFSLEASDGLYRPGPVDRYLNLHFTGEPNTPWYESIHRHGTFRRGAILGTSSVVVEKRILETNPSLHATFFDLSVGPLERRLGAVGKQFAGRVATQSADLNFTELPSETYDLIVSSSTIHHVTNLEHLAYQINRALTPDGLFFLDDYVGETRFTFSDQKRQVYERVFNRDRERRGEKQSGLLWLGTTDISPFCGVRSDETLDVFARYLQAVEVHKAAALVTPLLRSRPQPEGDSPQSPWFTDSWVLNQTRWRHYISLLKYRFPRIFGRLAPMQSLMDPRFLDELFLIGDVLTEAGLLTPGQAFAIYRKR